jgi:hypothetical protein
MKKDIEKSVMEDKKTLEKELRRFIEETSEEEPRRFKKNTSEEEAMVSKQNTSEEEPRRFKKNTSEEEAMVSKQNTSEEGVDYYLEKGNIVFTEEYHKKRGYCCESNCRHCPYVKNS